MDHFIPAGMLSVDANKKYAIRIHHNPKHNLMTTNKNSTEVWRGRHQAKVCQKPKYYIFEVDPKLFIFVLMLKSSLYIVNLA